MWRLSEDCPVGGVVRGGRPRLVLCIDACCVDNFNLYFVTILLIIYVLIHLRELFLEDRVVLVVAMAEAGLCFRHPPVSHTCLHPS